MHWVFFVMHACMGRWSVQKEATVWIRKIMKRDTGMQIRHQRRRIPEELLVFSLSAIVLITRFSYAVMYSACFLSHCLFWICLSVVQASGARAASYSRAEPDQQYPSPEHGKQSGMWAQGKNHKYTHLMTPSALHIVKNGPQPRLTPIHSLTALNHQPIN